MIAGTRIPFRLPFSTCSIASFVVIGELLRFRRAAHSVSLAPSITAVVGDGHCPIGAHRRRGCVRYTWDTLGRRRLWVRVATGKFGGLTSGNWLARISLSDGIRTVVATS
jgi:hypothetical protein